MSEGIESVEHAGPWVAILPAWQAEADTADEAAWTLASIIEEPLGKTLYVAPASALKTFDVGVIERRRRR